MIGIYGNEQEETNKKAATHTNRWKTLGETKCSRTCCKIRAP